MTSVDVLDSIVVGMYIPTWIIKPENRDTTWQIITPSGIGSMRTTSAAAFYEKLKELTPKRPEFTDLPDLWLEFKEEGYVKWSPEEYK